MNRAKPRGHAEDIKRLLEVKDAQPPRRGSSVGSDGSDNSDLSTKSMPQYSSYRQLSGGLFGPFEDSPTRPNSRSFLPFLHSDKNKNSPKMSHIPSKLKTPAKPRTATNSRPTSPSTQTPQRPGLQRETSASKLPVYRREASMPQLRRESMTDSMKREKSEIKGRPPPSNACLTMASARGTNTPIKVKTTPKTAQQQKISNRNISARGTRSGVSGVSDHLTIGDKVTIATTQKSGTLLFIGETRFAKGIWAGVVLDDESGKNDGSVSGVRYFSCPRLRGVFVKEDKVERMGSIKSPEIDSSNTSLSKTPTTPHVTNSFNSEVEEGHDLHLGDYVQISTTAGTKEGYLRYVGLTGFAKGTWCGVELKEATGKNDGAVAGTRYFQCESKHGIFAQLHKVRKLSSSSGGTDEPPLSPAVTPSGGASGALSPLDSGEETDATLKKAIEVAMLQELPPPQQQQQQQQATLLSSKPPTSCSPKNTHTAELEKKISILQNQLHRKDNELQRLDEENKKNEGQEGMLREHQESHLRLQSQVNQHEREKLELQNQINDYQKEVENLQFQLEEQMLLADDEGPSRSDLDKVLGLEASLKEKDLKIEKLREEIDLLKRVCEEETFKLDEKDAQMEGKNQEVLKLNELLQLTKDNESAVTIENVTLKKQLQELRDSQGTLNDAELERARMKSDSDSQLLRKDVQIKDLQSELDVFKTKVKNADRNADQKNEQIANLEMQIKQMREEVNSTVESKGGLNKQIVDLSKELDEKRIEIQSYTSTSEDLRKNILDWKAKFEAAETRNGQLIDDKKRLEEEILKVSKNSGDNAQQLLYHNQQLQQKNGEIATLQDKLSVMTAEINKKIQEIKDIEQKSANEKQASQKERSEEVKRLKESINVLEDHYKKLKAKNEQIEEGSKLERLELQKSSSTVQSLQDDAALKENKIRALSEQLDIFNRKLQDGEKQSTGKQSELECAKNTLIVREGEMKQLRAEFDQLRADYASLSNSEKNSAGEISRVTKECNALRVKLTEAERSAEHVGKERNAVSQACEEILAKAELVNKEKHKLQKEKEKLETDKKMLIEEMETVHKLMEETSSESKNSGEELKLLRQQMNDGSSQVQNIQTHLTSANKDLAKSNEKYKKSEDERQELLRKQLVMAQEKEELQSQLLQKTRTDEERIRETSLLQDQLAQAMQREQTLRNTLDNDRKKMQELQTGTQNEINRLKIQISEQQQQKSTAASLRQSPPPSSRAAVESSFELEEMSMQLDEVTKTKNEKEAEVNFLNSIIVELQRKNKEQEDKIKILSYGDEIQNSDGDLNTTMSPPKAGLRARAFCDICDIFDAHETEDCPLQSNSNDGGGVQHHGVRNAQRPYCTICEAFGHSTENCDDEETF